VLPHLGEGCLLRKCLIIRVHLCSSVVQLLPIGSEVPAGAGRRRSGTITQREIGTTAPTGRAACKEERRTSLRGACAPTADSGGTHCSRSGTAFACATSRPKSRHVRSRLRGTQARPDGTLRVLAHARCWRGGSQGCCSGCRASCFCDSRNGSSWRCCSNFRPVSSGLTPTPHLLSLFPRRNQRGYVLRATPLP
jgi:hypothetical protein